MADTITITNRNKRNGVTTYNNKLSTVSVYDPSVVENRIFNRFSIGFFPGLAGMVIGAIISNPPFAVATGITAVSALLYSGAANLLKGRSKYLKLFNEQVNEGIDNDHPLPKLLITDYQGPLEMRDSFIERMFERVKNDYPDLTPTYVDDHYSKEPFDLQVQPGVLTQIESRFPTPVLTSQSAAIPAESYPTFSMESPKGELNIKGLALAWNDLVKAAPTRSSNQTQQAGSLLAPIVARNGIVTSQLELGLRKIAKTVELTKHTHNLERLDSAVTKILRGLVDLQPIYPDQESSVDIASTLNQPFSHRVKIALAFAKNTRQSLVGDGYLAGPFGSENATNSHMLTGRDSTSLTL